MDRRIQHVHFQITRNCNLRCHFCGQWGKKGFFADSKEAEMALEDWENIINQLKEYREKTGENICVTVWGGEPLVSPIFDRLMLLLKESNFITEVITNGVLLLKHKEIINSCVDRMYVSLDGTKEVHNEIRGNGIYENVTAALKELNHKNVTVMSVITKKLMDVLPEFLDELNSLNIKDLYLQHMIGLSSDEIKSYAAWLSEDFGINAKEIYSWENSSLFKSEINISKKYNYDIVVKKHTDDKIIICKSPFNHVHITWNGNVLYCTDFYDFSAGNVREDDLESIFLNEKSEKFRAGILNNRCTSCNHCSWRCG